MKKGNLIPLTTHSPKSKTTHWSLHFLFILFHIRFLADTTQYTSTKPRKETIRERKRRGRWWGWILLPLIQISKQIEEEKWKKERNGERAEGDTWNERGKVSVLCVLFFSYFSFISVAKGEKKSSKGEGKNEEKRGTEREWKGKITKESEKGNKCIIISICGYLWLK